MNLFILLSCACNSNSSVLSLIFDGITAFGIVFAGIALFFSRRTECLTVMDKNTKEFREIVRNDKKPDAEKADDKKTDAKTPSNEITRNDYLGLFNEQLFYIGKWYLPKEIALEWLTTIYRYVIENEENRFSCKNRCIQKNIFECNCKENKDVQCFERVNTFYKICKEKKEKELKTIYKWYYRCPFSRCRRKNLIKKIDEQKLKEKDALTKTNK